MGSKLLPEGEETLMPCSSAGSDSKALIAGGHRCVSGEVSLALGTATMLVTKMLRVMSRLGSWGI